MAIVNSSEKKSTKDLLIEAAFSFYSSAHYEDFSMSQLAAKVGISKPAIYKHFINKEAVMAAMHNHFYDLIASHLIEIQHSNKKENSASSPLFLDLITLFAENPQYVNYFLTQFSNNNNYEEIILNELHSRGVENEIQKYSKIADDVTRLSYSIYSGLSLLFFIKIRENTLKELKLKGNIKKFAPNLINFILGGLKGISRPGDSIFPVEISQKRMKELDKICSLEDDILPEENKIFKAFASVITKYQISGVTVERIAGELNMAKSSLYFYFENKNQMIKSLVEKELALLSALINENTAEAENYSEFLYITMKSEVSFFNKRRSLIPICGWLLQSSAETPQNRGTDKSGNSKWESELGPEIKQLDLGFPVLPCTLTFWSGILPVGLIVASQKHCFTEEQTNTALNMLFQLIQNGIAE